jgi:hypothetical protein
MFKKTLIYFLCIIFAAGAVTAYGGWKFGSIDVLAEYLRGRRLTTPPSTVILSTDAHDEVHEGLIRIVNMGAGPGHIVGSRCTCSCISVLGLPVALSESGNTFVNVRINVGKGTSDQKQTVLLYIETDRTITEATQITIKRVSDHPESANEGAVSLD